MKKTVSLVVALLAIPTLSVCAADAKANYDDKCTKCHGEDGKGKTTMGKRSGAKDYTDAKVQAELTDEAAFKAIKEGYKTKDGKEAMKPVEDLSDDEIKALVAYKIEFRSAAQLPRTMEVQLTDRLQQRVF
jgi:cytochrome c553